VKSEHLPLILDGKLDDAWLLVTHDRAPLNKLLRDMNLRLGAVLLLAVIVSVLLAIFLSGRISRPLRDLADRTANLDLDSLDVDFSSSRNDEVGRLSRLLGDMTGRLRDGVKRLRTAEHRATMGEMARQVNHDIRNGITPLRNVLRHLSEVADDDPAQLNTVFAERRETLEGGLAYLEDLATHYARLSPGRQPQGCRLYEVIAGAMADPSIAPGVKLANTVPANLPAILADPVSLRRIFDNLIRNALDSLPDGQGTVSVDATVDEDPNLEELRILVSVSDTGEGIPPENLDAIFTDFFTTRKEGTGLGLSNVRRLAADCGANIRVTSTFVPDPRPCEQSDMSVILIIDDVAAMRDQYAYDLKRLGRFETLTAGGGSEGLVMLEGEEVEIILPDPNSPLDSPLSDPVTLREGAINGVI